MSHKVAKAERKDLKEREKGFIAAMDAASKQFKIGLRPVMQYNAANMIPAMRLIDEADAYEHVTPEAQAQNEAERTISSPEASESDTAATPQIET